MTLTVRVGTFLMFDRGKLLTIITASLCAVEAIVENFSASVSEGELETD